MNNYSDVNATAVTGGLRHAQPGLGVFLQRRSWLPTRNDAMRLAVPTVSPAIAAVTATAKQAPQSRGSSAHT